MGNQPRHHGTDKLQKVGHLTFNTQIPKEERLGKPSLNPPSSVAHTRMADSWVSKASKLALHPLCKNIIPCEDETRPVMLLQLSQHDVQGFSKHGPSHHMPAGSVAG